MASHRARKHCYIVFHAFWKCGKQKEKSHLVTCLFNAGRLDASRNSPCICFCYSWGSSLHSGHMFRPRRSHCRTLAQTHSYSWACALIVSICCPWCLAAALLLTNWPFHRRLGDKTQVVTPPTGRPPNQLHTPHTHTATQWAPQSQKRLLLWPLCDFRASLFNKVL